MLRAILKRKIKNINGLQHDYFFSVEFESGELEAMLRSGGMSEDEYSHCELIGIEVFSK